jgi:hypothetical protein
MFRLAVTLTTTIMVAGLMGRPSPPPPSPARVLFVGNSLTSWNDLPLLVEAMSLETTVPMRCESVTQPDSSIEDHWNGGAREKVRKGGWKYVVLQQGPSSLEASRENLREWTRKFAPEIREAGATPALYMVWPDRSRIAFFPEVYESYRLAAEDVSGILLPAGAAWAAAWRRDKDLELYGSDGLHPSKLGTYAAAATIFSRLAGVPAESLKPRYRLRNGDDFKVDPAHAATVLAAVAEVIRLGAP